MRQDRNTRRDDLNVTNYRIGNLKIGILLEIILDDVETHISPHCKVDDLIHIHGPIAPIQSHLICSIGIFISHNSFGHIDEYFLQSTHYCNAKLEIINSLAIFAIDDFFIKLGSQFHLIIVDSSNGSQVHTLNIPILVG